MEEKTPGFEITGEKEAREPVLPQTQRSKKKRKKSLVYEILGEVEKSGDPFPIKLNESRRN